MVRHHVAQRAGRVVETAAVADIELFVDRDLHMVDVVAIPDRLEHAVGEAQHQDVLHRLLAEIVIDPVDLVLIENSEQFVVQRLRRGEVGSERLFDHQPSPYAVLLPQHPGAAEFAGDRRKGVRRRRQIEQAVAAGLPAGFEFLEPFAQLVERSRILRIGFDAGDAFEQSFGERFVDRDGGKFAAGPSSGCRATPRSTCPGGRCRPRRACRARGRRRRDYRARGSPAGASDRRWRRRSRSSRARAFSGGDDLTSSVLTSLA